MSYEENLVKEIQEERKKLQEQAKKEMERRKQEYEAEKKKKEQEQAFKEKEREASRKRELDILMQGWTVKHKAIWEELCNEGLDPRQVASIDLTGQRGIKYKQLLTEFLNLPLDLGEIALTRHEYFTVYTLGTIFEIYRDENNKWKLRYDYKLLPHTVKLVVENDMPIALETHVNNPLFPEMPLKAVVKLKK